MKECQSQAGLSKLLDFLLEPLQKFRCRDAVHLGVVELEGHRQRGAQPLFPVFAPDEEGIVAASGVDVHRAVDLIPCQSRGADDRIVLTQLIALPALADLPGELPIPVFQGGYHTGILSRFLASVRGAGHSHPRFELPCRPLLFRGGAPCAGARILQEKKTSQEETSPRVIFVYISKRRPEPLLPLGGAYCRSGVRRTGDTTGSARKIISWMSLHRRNPVCFIQEAWNDSGETTISPFLYAERKL